MHCNLEFAYCLQDSSCLSTLSRFNNPLDTNVEVHSDSLTIPSMNSLTAFMLKKQNTGYLKQIISFLPAQKKDKQIKMSDIILASTSWPAFLLDTFLFSLMSLNPHSHSLKF